MINLFVSNRSHFKTHEYILLWADIYKYSARTMDNAWYMVSSCDLSVGYFLNEM